MTDAEIYTRLTQIFEDVFGEDDIKLTPATTAKDIENWDSFNHINIVLAAEQTFGVKFKTSEVESVRDVGELVKMIQEKRAASV